MADIRISTATLEQTAKDVRNHANNLNNILEDCLKEMLSLESTWKSDSATEIRTNMQALQNKFFAPYKSVVDSYAKFLDDTAATYESMETGIEKNAQSFK
ncbi:MAG: WXG100 family type VII secretion target [Clostridia bacterium]|nr:WXG100 family type VII secretion target [Clostridia bacterium]